VKVLLVGGGGREHALARAMLSFGHDLRFTDSNAGFSRPPEPGEPEVVAAREHVDLVVVGPEGPLVGGLADRLAGTAPCFGPTQAAARLEGSKIHAKRFCLRNDLPTAEARVLEPGEEGRFPGPGVVKLDGLAAGKGVWVCQAGAVEAAIGAARRANPGARILVEERLEGLEVSVLALCDGERAVPLLPARDHKRRFDGDRGPNTGGMGAVVPVAVADLAACEEILGRAVRAMAAEGTPFRGVLYGGFMLTKDGPRLLEFNVRFGDPECQPLMTLLDEDPAPLFLAAATARLPDRPLRWKAGAACTVVVCAEGYPEGKADAPIVSLPADASDLVVHHAGSRRTDAGLRAAGGRVLSVTGLGPTPATARKRAYEGVSEVRFDGMAWRTDIGATWA
jgi:phosphoribosylamine--glycine ligase